MNKLICVKDKYGLIIPIQNITRIEWHPVYPIAYIGDKRNYITQETYNKLIEQLEIL